MSHAPLVILSSSETSNQPLLPSRQTDSTEEDDLLSMPLSRQRKAKCQQEHNAPSPLYGHAFNRLFCCLCVLTEFRSGKATVSAAASEEPSTLCCADQFRPFFLLRFSLIHMLCQSQPCIHHSAERCIS